MARAGSGDSVGTLRDEDGGRRASPVIEMAQVAFAYGDGPSVLEVAELVVAPGEKVFVEGPSGSGKSTLLALLGGVALPTKGRVDVLGAPLSSLKPWARDRFRAERMGFVFQMFNLVPYLSVLDNVLLPCRFSRARAQRAGGAGALAGEAKRLLHRLGLGPEFALRSATSLSIGQQQRVAVARALMGRPDVLLADEPTSALDSGNRSRFLRLLVDECAATGTTVVFASHDPALGQMFDRRLSLGGERATNETNSG